MDPGCPIQALMQANVHARESEHKYRLIADDDHDTPDTITINGLSMAARANAVTDTDRSGPRCCVCCR
jgi:hypothetical protein